MKRHNIIVRRQAKNLQISPGAQEMIENWVEFFLDKVGRELQSGLLHEDDTETADKTHFCFSFDNLKTPGFRNDATVKYADLASGGEDMNMTMRSSEGKKACTENSFVIFKNEDENYTIGGVPSGILRVFYRTDPWGWAHSRAMLKGASQRRSLSALPTV